MKLLISLIAIFTLTACGDDESPAGCTSGCVGTGSFRALTSGITSFSLDNSAANQEYAFIPFALGGEDINGTSDENLGSLAFGTGSESSEETTASANNVNLEILTFNQVDHMVRGFLNRATRDSLENNRLLSKNWTNPTRRSALGQWQHLVDFRKLNENLSHKNHKKRVQIINDDACPEELDFEFIGVEDIIESSDYLEKQNNGGDFCVIVLGEDPKTVASLEDIKSSIATAYGNYKLIYETDFKEQVDGFSFKPVFVILPFDNTQYWPLGGSSLQGVTGAYFHQISDDNGQPILVMPTDLSKVNDQLSTEDAVTKFHATLAHELQHAILDFYRYWINGDQQEESIEIGSIDEGLAHYMEDVNGYGDDTFASFAELFLLRFASNTAAILDNNDSPLSRGGAHSLLYYLVSQKGGLAFKDGTVDTDLTTSPGIEFLRSYVKGKFHGTKGLFEAYGSNKTEAIGGYVGALATNGGSGFTNSGLYSTQTPVKDVTDTRGQNNKTFGMQFNNFGNVPDVQDRTSDYPTASNLNSSSLKYYLPVPFTYTTQEANETVAISVDSSTENVGVTVIRLK